MQREVRLLEAYVPGLAQMPAARIGDTCRAISAALAGEGQTSVLVVIPADETMLVLAWRVDDKVDLPAGAMLHDAVMSSGIEAVIQRVVDAQLIRPEDAWD